MSSDDDIVSLGSSRSATGELVKVALDTPNGKAAVEKGTHAALTIATTINTVLLPLAAVNFGIEKARDYFCNRFQTELEEKAGTIPTDQVVAPKASLAGSVLQGLAFAHEEPNLKEMYMSLLASAMDGRVAPSVHPAFVEVIRQLSSEEAELLHGGLRTSGGIAIAEIRSVSTKDGEWRVLYRNLLNLFDSSTRTPTENPNMSLFVDNWCRLGIYDVSYTNYLSEDGAYDWVEQRPEFLRLKENHESEVRKVTFQKGGMALTSFGAQFATAIGVAIPPVSGT